MLDAFISYHNLAETIASLHTDNCCGQNKNTIWCNTLCGEWPPSVKHGMFTLLQIRQPSSILVIGSSTLKTDRRRLPCCIFYTKMEMYMCIWTTYTEKIVQCMWCVKISVLPFGSFFCLWIKTGILQQQNRLASQIFQR